MKTFHGSGDQTSRMGFGGSIKVSRERWAFLEAPEKNQLLASSTSRGCWQSLLVAPSRLCPLLPLSRVFSASAPPASLLLRMLGIISQPPAEPRVLSPTPGPKFNHICIVPVTMQIKYSQVSGLRTQRSLESHLSAYHTQIRVEVIYWVRECRK